MTPEPFPSSRWGLGTSTRTYFRGTFMLPGALGGLLGGAIERVDTRGPQNEEPGSLTGVWLKYTMIRSRRGGLEFDYRRRSVERTLYEPDELARSDWTVRGRLRLHDAVVAGAHYSGSSLEGRSALVGDTTQGPAVRQIGADLSAAGRSVWSKASARWFDNPGLPSSRMTFEGGWDDERVGGIEASWTRESWDGGESPARTAIRAWTTSRYGVYGFVALDQGAVGVPNIPFLSGGFLQADTADPIPFDPGLRIEDRSTRRVGGGISWRGLEGEVAQVRVEVDSIFPLGLNADRNPWSVPGGVRTGIEARASVPLLLLDGLEAQGHIVQWDTVDGSWPYVPERQYDARLHYRQTFLPTGNFEMQLSLGARERTGMSVVSRLDTIPAPVIDPEAPASPTTAALETVPFYQSWYARLQLRIVSLRIFVEWENVTLRPENQDFPGRILPRTRSSYGVRWTLRN